MAQSSHWILEMISLCEKMEQFTYIHIIWVCLTLEESSKTLRASNLRASFYWEFIPSPPFFISTRSTMRPCCFQVRKLLEFVENSAGNLHILLKKQPSLVWFKGKFTGKHHIQW